MKDAYICYVRARKTVARALTYYQQCGVNSDAVAVAYAILHFQQRKMLVS